MPDILTLWNTTRGDWQRAGGSLASGNDIVTSVLISLFTDRVATPDDTVPDATRRLRDPRGWWADESIGSRLWLIDRAKRTPATLQRAQAYIVEALQWLVDDGVASRIEVTTEWTRQDTLGALVVVYSPRTGAPLVKIGTQNVFRLPDAQAWGWNAERGAGQWVELQPSLAVAPMPSMPSVPSIWDAGTSDLRYGSQVAWVIAGANANINGFQNFPPNTPQGGVQITLYGNNYKSAGKKYFEILIKDTSSSDADHVIGKLGIAQAGYSGGHFPFYANGSGGITGEPEPSSLAGSSHPGWANGSAVIVGIAVDFLTGRVWMSLNGSWGSGDPASGINPAYSTVVGPVVPFVRYYAVIMTATAAIRGASPTQTYPAPVGFTAWDD